MGLAKNGSAKAVRSYSTRRSWKKLLGHYFKLTRLHKFPLGVTVVALPSMWGMTMAAYHTKSVALGQFCSLACLWYFSDTIRHSAACVWSDICDRDVDRLVERSKNRPIASGAVSVSEALCLYATLILCHLWMLSWLDGTSGKLSVVGLLIFDIPYALSKRWTYWPQAYLGISLAAGILTSWLSVSTMDVNIPAIVALFIGYACWTIVYDSMYACQDRKDDVKAGVKSTAVLFASYIREILAAFAVIFVLSLLVAGILNKQGPFYFIITVLGAAAHLSWQLCTLDFEDAEQCGKMFKRNGDLGYLLWAGMLLDYLWVTIRH